MSRPFKMKGSPMQRNFGVGSPLHQDTYVPPGVVSNKGKSKFKVSSLSDAFNKFKSSLSTSNKNVYVPPGVVSNNKGKNKSNSSKDYVKKATDFISTLFN